MYSLADETLARLRTSVHECQQSNVIHFLVGQLILNLQVKRHFGALGPGIVAQHSFIIGRRLVQVTIRQAQIKRVKASPISELWAEHSQRLGPQSI